MVGVRPKNGVYVSALELFSIGVGPSSSHTVGPMRAGHDFVTRLKGNPHRIQVRLYGSLAATGIGHGSPDAVIAGLVGMEPETCDPALVRGAWQRYTEAGTLPLYGHNPVGFTSDDVAFDVRGRPGEHPNTLVIDAFDERGEIIESMIYQSVGGGFIQRGLNGPIMPSITDKVILAHADGFSTAADLLSLCTQGRTIADIARSAEDALRPWKETQAGLDLIWQRMRECIKAGMGAEGTLPGPLKVPRRAKEIAGRLKGAPLDGWRSHTGWLQAYALAVNEENAAGGRVVTAPTNGAAGILPAVLMHFYDITPTAASQDVYTFLLTAAAIGSLIRANASISGAAGGCQAEVGSACAMAAAGLCAVLGGNPMQVENAAEIAVEHHLGLTCDPVAGLVQIPCIERNAIAASTAVAAAQLALNGDGQHIVTLDTVIETMRQTGVDMDDRYKETSMGGLAVNVVEC